jgi:hypothetical protein
MVAASSSRNAGVKASFAQFLVYGLLFLQLASVAEAGKLSTICNKLNCFSKSDDGPTQKFPKLPSAGITCPNPKAPKGAKGWNVYKHAKPMPSVSDIAADIKLCGILSDKTSTVFYSFNGGYSNAKEFMKKNPDLNGKTINDVLPEIWYTALGKVPGLASPAGMARTAWIARTSQALATASRGDAYLVADPSANIYTVPYTDKGENDWKGPHNVWFDYEFATLQNNNAVKGIYTVDSKFHAVDKSATGSWVRNRTPQGRKAGNHINANKVTAASLQKQKDDYNKGDCGDLSNSNGKRGAGSSSASGAAACKLNPKTISKTGLNTRLTTLATKTKTSAKTTKISAKATKTSCPRGKKKC